MHSRLKHNVATGLAIGLAIAWALPWIVSVGINIGFFFGWLWCALGILGATMAGRWENRLLDEDAEEANTGK